jgi:hypothetical protein
VGYEVRFGRYRVRNHLEDGPDQAGELVSGDDDLIADRVSRQVERLQFLGELLDEFDACRARVGEVAVGADDDGIAMVGRLCDPMQGHVHMVTVQQDRGDRIAFDLDQGDATTHRDRAGWCVEGDVLLLADLAADIAEDAGGKRRGKVAVLLLRVEDEIVDDDFRVLRHCQRRLIGKKQLGLAAVAGADLLVMNDVVADEEFAL